MENKLALHIIDSNDTRFMRILDMSCYAPPITGEKLLIKAPGFTKYRDIFVAKNFNLLVSTVNLHLTDEVGELEDGIYNIKYSISPNADNWVEYNHLRATSILQKYYKVLASLEIDCNLNKDKREKLNQMRDIKSYIDAAKIYVEYTSSIERGSQLYTYANKKLLSLQNKTC